MLKLAFAVWHALHRFFAETPKGITFADVDERLRDARERALESTPETIQFMG